MFGHKQFSAIRAVLFGVWFATAFGSAQLACGEYPNLLATLVLSLLVGVSAGRLRVLALQGLFLLFAVFSGQALALYAAVHNSAITLQTLVAAPTWRTHDLIVLALLWGAPLAAVLSNRLEWICRYWLRWVLQSIQLPATPIWQGSVIAPIGPCFAVRANTHGRYLRRGPPLPI